MSKYIIDLDDNVQIITCIGASAHGTIWVKGYDVDDLEELNFDYINEHYGELQDEAYKQGYEDAERIWRAPSSDNEFYRKGLEDAWEAAKKIVVDTDHGGIAMGTLCEIFDTRSYSFIMRGNTAQEAIDKIKAYEDKQKDRIEVGDEVDWNGDCFVVTRIYQPLVDKRCNGIAKDGSVYMDVVCDRLTKTGRHFDIASILEAMRK